MKNWEANTIGVHVNDPKYSEYKFYRGAGVTKFYIDDEAEDIIIIYVV